MSLSVDFSAWQIKPMGSGETTTETVGGDRTGIQIIRTYEYSDSQTKKRVATLHFMCSLELGFGGFSVNSFLSFFFKPFPLPQEISLIMGLPVLDKNGNTFAVTACPVQGDPDMSLLFVRGREETDKCLQAFLLGQHLSFTLAQLDPKEDLVKLPLPNDGEFKQVYKRTHDQLVRSDDSVASESTDANITEEVRKNPAGFNVWMVEPNPGEYSVLLVRLDGSGGMADSWTFRESFSDRKEQGAYALEVARDLRIKLMDLVKQ